MFSWNSANFAVKNCHSAKTLLKVVMILMDRHVIMLFNTLLKASLIDIQFIFGNIDVFEPRSLPFAPGVKCRQLGEKQHFIFALFPANNCSPQLRNKVSSFPWSYSIPQLLTTHPSWEKFIKNHYKYFFHTVFNTPLHPTTFRDQAIKIMLRSLFCS